MIYKKREEIEKYYSLILLEEKSKYLFDQYIQHTAASWCLISRGMSP